ncbi:MAG TPA: outer membrane beta-barrel protein [Stellaceae bacterium]|nr:outer membrane beta-barrel protein [Stellaceae bacterium]
MNRKFFAGTAAVALLAGLALSAPARADDQTPAPPPHPMVGPVMISGHIEAGTNVNFDDPANNNNFGQLFTDRANSFRMNQLMLTAEKDLDSAAKTVDWGFKIQGMYGTDARFTHSTGLWDLATHSPYQFDFVEFNGQAHLPIIASGGIDLKAGIYSTPIGYEVIDATGNFFYTHSYIFNFGIPLKHTGVLSVSHITPMFDLWAGVDTGVNTWLPTRGGDNNGSPAVLFGLGVNNPIPNLTILALSHLGPENGYVKGTSNTYVNGAGALQDPNHHARQIYDVVTSYKVNDALTVANEIDFIKDDLAVVGHHSGATAEGAALYGIYAFNDQLSFGARGEVFRDDQGFFVAGFGSGQDFMRAERGITAPGPNTVYGGFKATYSELTLGVNYKPPLPAMPLNTGLTIRPELRWDHAYGVGGNGKAFNMNSAGNNTSNDQFMFSIDGIVGF